MHLRARRSAQPFGGSRMLLSPRAAIIASAGALLAWLSVLFGTIQVAYMLDAYSVLNQDIAIACELLPHKSFERTTKPLGISGAQHACQR
jgi:hypothetical protein